MSFPLTEDMFKSMFPKAKSPKKLFAAMESTLDKYEINTEDRIAMFLAQCGHESGGFRLIEENLNYSAKALDAVFGKYFARGGRDAKEYERQPEKIANVVYANRMDNGDTDSGDGYRFRGRGFIQLTGRYNYTQFAESIGKDIDDTIAYLETVEGALESACWFWTTNGLNKYADKQDIKGATKRINGGYIGLEDRQHHYEEALAMLGGEVKPHVEEAGSVDLTEVISVGSRGDTVKAVQEKLGLTADGIFGPGTKRAVKQWQMANGLVADGVAGPNTLKKMFA